MIRMLTQAAVLAAVGFALGGCQMEQAKTSAPVRKAPAPDYQLANAPMAKPSNLSSICYSDTDIAVMRGRMLQQQMAVATLQCQTASGSRALEGAYTSFLTKFNGDLANNARNLNQLSRTKRFNVDVVVTEFANRTAQRAPVDRDFCTRSQRALEWALDSQVTSMGQVPPPFDLGPEMSIFPCNAP